MRPPLHWRLRVAVLNGLTVAAVRTLALVGAVIDRVRRPDREAGHRPD